MKTAQELRDKFDSDMEELKNNCPHPDISDWMRQEWAPAHSTGNMVKICNICWKVVETKKNKSSFPPITVTHATFNLPLETSKKKKKK